MSAVGRATLATHCALEADGRLVVGSDLGGYPYFDSYAIGGDEVEAFIGQGRYLATFGCNLLL
ncbi:hypothetical protein D3C81_1884880 [compost metagenome]